MGSPFKKIIKTVSGTPGSIERGFKKGAGEAYKLTSFGKVAKAMRDTMTPSPDKPRKNTR